MGEEKKKSRIRVRNATLVVAEQSKSFDYERIFKVFFVKVSKYNNYPINETFLFEKQQSFKNFLLLSRL